MESQNPKDPAADPNRKNTRSTLIVMGCTMGSRILGFLRMALIGAVFGAQGSADVLNAVFTIPNNLRKLLAEGALSSAFIPTLTKTMHEDPQGRKPRQLSSTLLGFQMLLLIPLSLIAALGAGPIIKILTGFTDPGKTELAVSLFRWLFHYILLISVSSVLMAVLNAHSRFTIPAISPLLFSLSVIISIAGLHRQLGIYAMAVGVLAGGAAQLLFQTPLFLRLGYSLKPSCAFQSPEFRSVLRQWAPVLATSSIFAVNHQVAIRFATGLSNGSPSALTNALVFWQLPFGIFSASITTVLFPQMSRQAAAGDKLGLKKTLQYGLRSQITLLVPSSVYLILMGEPMISVALQRGAFYGWNTLMAARVLTAYSLGLFSVGSFNYLQRFFYSLGNYRIPFYVSAAVTAADILLSLWWKETWMGVAGLAAANSAAFTLGILLLLAAARKEIGGLGLKEVSVTLGRIILSMVLPIIYIGLFFHWTGNWWAEGSSWAGLGLFMILALGTAALQFLGYIIVKAEMVWILLRKKQVPS